jgi:hypothetical protein
VGAATTPLPEMVDALNAYQPQAMTAYPSIAAACVEGATLPTVLGLLGTNAVR